MLAWALYAVTILWIVAYDTMYAMADREDDLHIGVKSTAIAFGNADRLIIALLQLGFLAGLSGIAVYLQAGVFFYLGILAAAGFAIYQQFLIRNREPSACLHAFLNNNWFGMVIFAGIFLDYML